MARRRESSEPRTTKRVETMMMGGAIIGGAHAPMYVTPKRRLKAPPKGGSAIANMESLFDIGEGAVNLGLNVVFTPKRTVDTIKTNLGKRYDLAKKEARKGTFEPVFYAMDQTGQNYPPSGDIPDDFEIPYEEEKYYTYDKMSNKKAKDFVKRRLAAEQQYMEYGRPREFEREYRMMNEPKREGSFIKPIPTRRFGFNEMELKDYSEPRKIPSKKPISEMTERTLSVKKIKKPFLNINLDNTLFGSEQKHIEYGHKKTEEKYRMLNEPKPKREIKSTMNLSGISLNMASLKNYVPMIKKPTIRKKKVKKGGK